MLIYFVFDESVTDLPTDQRTDRRTDRPTDRRTDRPGYRDARTHLKIRLIAQSDLELSHCENGYNNDDDTHQGWIKKYYKEFRRGQIDFEALVQISFLATYNVVPITILQ